MSSPRPTADQPTGGLGADYAVCRQLAARHGRTYFLATRLLPADRRPAVHALYGFARYADDLVDHAGEGPAVAAAALDALAADLGAARPALPVVRAVRDTAARYGIAADLFTDFLASMRSDLTVTSYPTYADLERYMWGSAAVIGLQLLPVLGTVGPSAEAAPYAVALGEAFQLTNFLRDVGEDLARGRVYLPADDIARFGVALDPGHPPPPVDGSFRRLLAHEIARTRARYADAAPGIALLAPTARDCVRTALTLYADILDAIERADYDVLTRRVRVGRARRLAVAGPGLVRAAVTGTVRSGPPISAPTGA